jgi:hypothetical protein
LPETITASGDLAPLQQRQRALLVRGHHLDRDAEPVEEDRAGQVRPAPGKVEADLLAGQFVQATDVAPR